MSLILKNATVDEDSPLKPLVSQYVLRHSGPKTVLELPLTLTVTDGAAVAAITVETGELPDVGEALDRLADHLERAAKSIRGRGEITASLPIFWGIS